MTPPRGRIAILAVRPASGEVGGAERAYSGLLAAFLDRGLDADLVNVVTDESTTAGVRAAYLRFSQLDLSSYAGVISTKAPAYVVAHPNHVVFLLHSMRVFYDMWDERADARHELARLRQDVLLLDRAALARARAVFAIGVEVAERIGSHLGLRAEVLRPPTTLTGLRGGRFEHLLLPGRLHPWKRVDLAIAAMRRVRRAVRLRIAGAGPAEESLRQLAAGDERIVFEGWVDDAELTELYADALAVLFTPIREDLGLVTLEAFASGKPVITCRDSGEAARLVRDGRSGFVCAPDPEALAPAIERLCDDHELAARLGAQGREDVGGITWEAVAERLASALGFALASGEPQHSRPRF